MFYMILAFVLLCIICFLFYLNNKEVEYKQELEEKVKWLEVQLEQKQEIPYVETFKSEYEQALKDKTVLEYQLSVTETELKNTLEDFYNAKLEISKIVSQKKSSEVNVGNMIEKLVPVLENLPYNPQDLHFLGMPIDFIHFDWETPKITFIEVKSGKSQESKRQRIIKNCIKKGLIEYNIVRIDSSGIEVKITSND